MKTTVIRCRLSCRSCLRCLRAALSSVMSYWRPTKPWQVSEMVWPLARHQNPNKIVSVLMSKLTNSCVLWVSYLCYYIEYSKYFLCLSVRLLILGSTFFFPFFPRIQCCLCLGSSGYSLQLKEYEQKDKSIFYLCAMSISADSINTITTIKKLISQIICITSVNILYLCIC